MEDKLHVRFFVRPNGAIYEIRELVVDTKTNTMKIVLENNLSRWFNMNEIQIVPPLIKMSCESVS
jgi:hypothetical protein